MSKTSSELKFIYKETIYLMGGSLTIGYKIEFHRSGTFKNGTPAHGNNSSIMQKLAGVTSKEKCFASRRGSKEMPCTCVRVIMVLHLKPFNLG